MALLRSEKTGLERLVRDRLVVGRSTATDLRLTASAVSNEHAVIQWTGADWVIRDLGSRNGTRVNDRLLLRSSFRLVVGDRITFGAPEECWHWADGGPPVALALRDDGGELEAKSGLLLLPDDETALAAVFASEERWLLEIDGKTREVRDGDPVEIGGQRFTLQLPSLAPEADRTQTIAPDAKMASSRIRFRVSLDEEHVAVVVESGGSTREVAPRAFHYMLLLLARRRRDEAARGIPDGEAGFMYVDELCEELRVDLTMLNVYVHRARRMLGYRKGAQQELWFNDAHALIQRRDGQIRLGVSDIVIDEPGR